MPKLPVLTSREIIQILEKRGFVERRQTGSHKIFYHSELKRGVVVPNHSGNLPKGTAHSILKSAGIQRDALF